jgi:hypothetical protein
MEVNFSKLVGGISGIVGILLIGGSMYFMYTIFSEGGNTAPEPTLANLNVSIFNQKIQLVAASITGSGQKISLDKKKDLIFTESKLYKSFTDMPEDVPLSDSRGRPDPFIPYVAP